MRLLITPISTLVTSGIREQDAGAASEVTHAARQLGGAIGLAALATAGHGTSCQTVFVTMAGVCDRRRDGHGASGPTTA
ncbi:hypothetical protein E1265_32140 [Streptomyces sp. 8K308]|uniref:hypothetical protein n=1 Tax=Streptomyces sp. 8K308 TaxID=2530388 RepID=UPI00104F5467|nr:hypothetical protein [Streptomyces sp. 8K308]TDC09543.1 hypothetical protein E1265_32140 [Streptomyces sp. 8K308]